MNQVKVKELYSVFKEVKIDIERFQIAKLLGYFGRLVQRYLRMCQAGKCNLRFDLHVTFMQHSA